MTKARELADQNKVVSNRNLLKNGEMRIAQRTTSKTGVGTVNGEYPSLDRVKFFGGNTAARFTVSQDNDTPEGFSKSLKIACTTADTSVAANEYFMMDVCVEGQNAQGLEFNTSSAKTSTVSFYVKGNAAARYSCLMSYHIVGGDARAFLQTFPVTTDWTRIELTYPGDPIAPNSGTYGILNGTAKGIQLEFWLHGGTNFSSGTAQETAWFTRDYTEYIGDNTTSIADATSRTFFMTGIQWEISSSATPFEYKTLSQDLEECQRYYCELNNLPNGKLRMTGYGGGGTTGGSVFQYPVTMRAVPTGSFTNGQTLSANNGAAASAVSALNATTGSTVASDINVTFGSSYTGKALSFYTGSFSAKTSFNFDAEL